MNPWATVVAGLGGATIAGIIALVLDSRRRAADKQAREDQLDREDEIRDNQDSRLRRERWDDHIRHLCARMVAADFEIERWLPSSEQRSLPEIQARMDAIEADRDIIDLSAEEMADWKDAHERFREAKSEYDKAYEARFTLMEIYYQIQLIAPETIVKAATNFMDVAVDRRFTSDKSPQHTHMRSEFLGTVRVRLGVVE